MHHLYSSWILNHKVFDHKHTNENKIKMAPIQKIINQGYSAVFLKGHWPVGFRFKHNQTLLLVLLLMLNKDTCTDAALTALAVGAIHQGVPHIGEGKTALNKQTSKHRSYSLDLKKHNHVYISQPISTLYNLQSLNINNCQRTVKTHIVKHWNWTTNIIMLFSRKHQLYLGHRTALASTIWQGCLIQQSKQ